jgi:hypothetical protein
MVTRRRVRRHKRSRKVKILDAIRSFKARAVFNRLRGRINDAMVHENLVDRLVSDAEAKGFGDQASNAEEAGTRIGQRIR